MTREEAIKEIEKVFEPAFANYIVEALTKGATVSEQELTTKNDLALIHTEGLEEEIRCTMCTNRMKSDRGCDGSCVVNNAMYKNVMDAIEKRIQPTTKNDLRVDCISRADAIRVASGYCHSSNIAKELAKLPSVTPHEPKWISVSKEMPEEKINVLVTLKSGEIGILKKIEVEDENGYPCYLWADYEGDIDYEVTAWMPLPKAYEEKRGNKIGWSSLENVREKVERGNEK